MKNYRVALFDGDGRGNWSMICSSDFLRPKEVDEAISFLRRYIDREFILHSETREEQEK